MRRLKSERHGYHMDLYFHHFSFFLGRLCHKCWKKTKTGRFDIGIDLQVHNSSLPCNDAIVGFIASRSLSAWSLSFAQIWNFSLRSYAHSHLPRSHDFSFVIAHPFFFALIDFSPLFIEALSPQLPPHVYSDTIASIVLCCRRLSWRSSDNLEFLCCLYS